MIERRDSSAVLSEHRLSRKSRATPIDIPVKGEPVNTRGLSIEISEIDLSKDKAPALTLYHHPATRDAVIDFFVSLTGSEEVALVTLYYSDKYKINPFLSFALVYTESRFSPEAINYNPSSVDRGLFQLNSKSFPNLDHDDFYNIDTNVRHGIQHLVWCLNVAGGDEERALAVYNAGFGRISSGQTPVSTKAYVRNIVRYKDNLAKKFKDHIAELFEAETSAAAPISSN